VPKPPPEPKETPVKAQPKVDIELKAREAAKAKQAEAVRLPDPKCAHKTGPTDPKFSEGASSAQKFRSRPSLAEN
jgi:hypothetical protein